jgi:hypothetical protein
VMDGKINFYAGMVLLRIVNPFDAFPAGRPLSAENRYEWSQGDHSYLFSLFPLPPLVYRLETWVTNVRAHIARLSLQALFGTNSQNRSRLTDFTLPVDPSVAGAPSEAVKLIGEECPIPRICRLSYLAVYVG